MTDEFVGIFFGIWVCACIALCITIQLRLSFSGFVVVTAFALMHVQGNLRLMDLLAMYCQERIANRITHVETVV